MTGSIALIALVSIAGSEPTGAHPHDYVAGGPVVVCANDGGLAEGVPSVGGTCYNGGHVGANEFGQAVITASDAIMAPVGMFVCQDLNGDGWCGDINSGELAGWGCDSVLIATWEGGYGDFTPWKPNERLFVFLDGADQFGNGFTTCGTFNWGTVGAVDHHS